MANADKNFDEYFQKKLSNHEVKPSGLAWERLDQKLSEQNRKVGYPFLKIAATVLLLIGSGYAFYAVNIIENEHTQQLAIQEEVIVKDNLKEEAPAIIQLPAESIVENEEPIELKETKNKSILPQVESEPENPSQELIAEASNPIETLQTEKIELPEITIPELNINETIVLNTTDVDEDQEVGYTVTIISKGIKEEPAKQNLIEEIEEKVDKIGGLFSKVEQGFADLQDAKNNLFANNNPRKERSR